MKHTTQKEIIMKNLQVSEAEAEEILKADKAIEQGADPFPLSADQKKAEKKMRGTGSRQPTVYQFSQKQKKVDNEKINIINLLREAIAEDIEIINPEREFTFTKNGKKYKITLSCPRS